MRKALLIAAVVLRVAAAASSALAAYDLAPHVITSLPVLPMPGAKVVSLAVAAAVALLALVGHYGAAIVALGIMAAVYTALGMKIPITLLAAIVSLLLAPMLVRRADVMEGSVVETRLYCSWGCRLATPAFYIVLLVGAYLVYGAAFALGYAVGSVLESLEVMPQQVAAIAYLATRLLAMRIIILLVILWVLYKAIVGLAEPLVYTILAHPRDVARLVNSILEGERRALVEGKTWHHKLYLSAASHVAGVITLIIAYSLMRVASTIYNVLLGGQPLPSAILAAEKFTTMTAPLWGLATYYAAYRFTRRRIQSTLAGGVSPPRATLPLLTVLAAAALLLYSGLSDVLLSVLLCPVQPTACTGVHEAGLAARISMVVSAAAESIAASIRRGVELIDSIVAMLFG
ncbi:hypothetical protein Pyrfu_1046 [Pyrolobus fumarii 1A]|uniref:Uncharacterized protein n=2 Tax=Pyrolobus fumarii TaxID=54252 RepID=G0EF17_PYRF1|nr:hypothetical protein Pyrfu_1046 [Pyrolobus fumarii 1A]